jgi:hypothetical protein
MSRAIKIDVEKQDVYYIDRPIGLDAIYEAIGNNCSMMEVATYLGSNAIYVDEEIMYRESDIRGGWAFPDFAQVIMNNGIIVGTTLDGEDADCTVTVEEIKAKIKFYRVAI